MMKFQTIIDLSVPIENGKYSDPPPLLPKVTYTDHKESFEQMASFFPGLTREELPDEEAWSIEHIELSTHSGTHLDAPYHHASTMDGGKRALRIDEVPLNWCFKPGVKLDFREFEDGYLVTADDVRRELDRIEYTLQSFDIVVVNTRAGKLFGTEHYLSSGCGMGREATLYLLGQGIKITGTDAWSWDAPFVYTAKKYAQNHDSTIIWEGHKASREIGYCHMEKLHNLESLPATGFYISCFPVKIRDASAGWTRAVALMD
jgi:kynurenine formamidase